MPWSMPMNQEDQRLHFISDWINGSFSIVDLAIRFCISRKTAYKWINRFFDYGVKGLSDLARLPKTCPHKTSNEIIEAILQIRKRRPSLGAKKILPDLVKKWPETQLPSIATINSILLKNGMVKSPIKRRDPGHPGMPAANMDAPNMTWCADFKGQFKLKNGAYCYPLTITDGYSRFLLACKALRNTQYKGAFQTFENTFREYGMPDRIRTDNGVPFGTHALARLSALSVWFIRLGIYPDHIEPGKPQQNGRHERMHKTLKAETTKPPESTFPRQQKKFDEFQKFYNEERYHEGIKMATPATLYEPSKKPFPDKLPELIYPKHFIERYVSHNGGIRFHSKRVLVTAILSGQTIGMEEIEDGIFNVYFGPVLLGKWFYNRPYVEGINNIRKVVIV